MKLLEDKIRSEGRIIDGRIIKVDGFLNHRLDVGFIDRIAEEFYNRYKDCGVNKIMTIESSGIAIAVLTARYFNVPVVFSKKHKSENISDDFYSARVTSFTHNNTYTAVISKEYLSSYDKVLIIDDILAQGEALRGMISMCSQAGAEIVGAGIAIEKAFQPGGEQIRAMGIRVESLARIKSMTENDVIFVEDQQNSTLTKF